MMKFLTLLKKEMRDLLNVQNLVTYGIMFLALFFMGNFTEGLTESLEEVSQQVAILDQDQSELSKGIIAHLGENGYEVSTITKEGEADDYIVIPKGFGAGIAAEEPQEIKMVSTVNSLAITQLNSGGLETVTEKINLFVVSQNTNTETTTDDAIMALQPVVPVAVSRVGDNSAVVSAAQLVSGLMSSTIIVPIIVMVLVVFSAQMIVSAISNEKTDKTLETLMSTPVPRTSVLLSKIMSAGIISCIVAALFTVSMMGSSALGSAESGDVVSQLGLALSIGDYALIGVGILISVAIALCLAFVLSVIATDAKSTQMTIFPLIILIMVPYFLTLFIDINSMEGIGKVIMYLIPFTHTFTAMGNLMFGDITLYLLGIAYQFLFLLLTIFVTVKIFSSDIIFTGIKFNKRRKKPMLAKR